MLRTSSRFSSVAPEQITRQKLTVAAVGSAPMKSRGFNFFPPTSFLFDPPFPTSDSSAFYILSSWLPVTQYTRTTDHEIAHSRETFPSSRVFYISSSFFPSHSSNFFFSVAIPLFFPPFRPFEIPLSDCFVHHVRFILPAIARASLRGIITSLTTR